MIHIKRIDEMQDITDKTDLTLTLNRFIKDEKYIRITDKDLIGNELGIKLLEMSKDGSYGDIICINHIETKTHNIGNGTRIMEIICEWADDNSITLSLTPSTDFGATSLSRLYNFYKKFGFVKNTGKHSNFNTKQSMYRPPCL